jgi:hypothetical protein
MPRIIGTGWRRQASGEHQREELCFVADLAKRDHDHRHQKSFHAEP